MILKSGRLALPKDCPSQINNLLWLESKIENALGVLRVANNGKKQHGQLLGPFHEEISIRMGMDLACRLSNGVRMTTDHSQGFEVTCIIPILNT